ncbi:MAG: hypothetical protein ACREVI_08490 [Steroidobacteraceae bacterium]
MAIQIRVEQWPLVAPFRITGRTFAELDVVVVTRRDGPFSMTTRIEAMREPIESKADREVLRRLLPAGGARNGHIRCPQEVWGAPRKHGSAATSGAHA